MLARVDLETKRYGRQLKIKRRRKGRLSSMATTYARVIALPHDWADRGPAAQAILLAHELVHVRQWAEYGRTGFPVRYLGSPRWRWALEMQAYAETIRASRVLGATVKQATARVEHIVENLRGPYALRFLDRRQLERESRAILLAEV